MRDIHNDKTTKRSSSSSNQNKTIYASVGLLLLVTMLSFVYLSSSRAHSEAGTAFGNTSSKASVTVAATCSMTATVNTAHSATIANGTYLPGIGQTTIKTFCNDPNGYAIYAIGFGEDTEGNTKLHSTALGDSFDINTGTAESGDTSNWAMQVNAVSASAGSTDLTPSIDGGYGTYKAVPQTYDKVAHFGGSTDAIGGVGSSVTTTYAAYIAGTQPAGTYNGQVKYVLIHPSSSDSPAVTTMQNVGYWGSSVSVGQEVTATDNRDGQTYTVARLCTNWEGNNCTQSQLWMTQNLDYTIASTEQNPINSLNTDLTQYQDNLGNTYAGYSVNDKGVITWQPNNTLNSPATISDFSYQSAAGSSVSGWTNSQTVPYQADGTLNSEDVYIVTSGNANRDTIYSSLSACKAAQSGTDAEKTAICQHYKVGNYYNWSAAVAMNNTTSYSEQYTDMPNSICPAGWRLPKGLQGDTPNPAETDDADATPATTISEFNKLFLANGITGTSALNGGTTGDGQWIGYNTGTGFNNIRTTSTYRDTNLPLYFARSGNVNGTTLYYSSYAGLYWSSSAVSGARAYYLRFNSGGLGPAYRDSRSNGISVRCVAREETTINDVQTMQEFASMSDKKKAKVVASMVTEKQYKLTDSRDNNEYSVAKLKDGKVWMTKNLNIAGGTTLTCDKTDCDGGYTLPSDQGWQSTPGKLPASSTTGFSDDNYAYVYNSGNTTNCGGDGQNTPCYSCYSWDAATLGSGRSITTENTDAPYSICPKGWRLPTSGQHDGTTALTNWKRGDFYRLLTAYGANLENAYNQNSAIFWNNAGAGTVANFLLSGYYASSAFNYGGTLGRYWSSTSSSSTLSRSLSFTTGGVNSASRNYRRDGFSVRCLLR